MSSPKPRIPAPGRYRLVRIATRPCPPTVPHPRGLCGAPAPQCSQGSTVEPRDPWADYAAARRAGLIHPPSVSTRTEADVRRAAAAVGGGARGPSW